MAGLSSHTNGSGVRVAHILDVLHSHANCMDIRPMFLDSTLETVGIGKLSISGNLVDLLLQRYPDNAGINAVRKHGNVEVVIMV